MVLVLTTSLCHPNIILCHMKTTNSNQCIYSLDVTVEMILFCYMTHHNKYTLPNSSKLELIYVVCSVIGGIHEYCGTCLRVLIMGCGCLRRYLHEFWQCCKNSTAPFATSLNKMLLNQKCFRVCTVKYKLSDDISFNASLIYPNISYKQCSVTLTLLYFWGCYHVRHSHLSGL